MNRPVILFAGMLGMTLALVAGCQKGDAPALSVSAPGSSTASSSKQHRLVGSWDGVFAMRADAATGDFDEATLTACKTMKIRIAFHADGTMGMTASMRLPEVGEQSNTSSGKWELVSESGDTVVVRSKEQGSQPEEIELQFRGDDVFEMTPPNQLQSLGVMRFTRESR